MTRLVPEAMGERLPVAILAGGLATRLGEVARSTPKALVEVAGRPFVFHQLDLLEDAGVERVVLCVAWLGEKVEQVVKDRYGKISISYSYEGAEPRGTLEAIRRALPGLGERFLVLYGDSYLRLDVAAFERGWRESGLPAAMTVLRNTGRWGTSNAIYRARRVTRYDKARPDEAMRFIDYGMGGLEASVLPGACGATDLADLYHELAGSGQLYGYRVTERFYEIGTPPALAETDRFLRRTRTRPGARGRPADPGAV